VTQPGKNPKLNRAVAEASIELAEATLPLTTLWLSALGALIVFGFSGAFFGAKFIHAASAWEKIFLVVLMFFVLFDIFAVSKIAEHSIAYRLACRNYLATSCEISDPEAMEAMAEVDKKKSALNSAYTFGVPSAAIILLMLLCVFCRMIFSF